METLADRIAREGPLNELDAVGWAIRLAKRIEAMHALGVTHGSVSPQCVQIEGKDRTARGCLVDLRRTSSSPSYQSPERLNGGALSQADDCWALACTLYATLTGSPPFSGATDAEVRQKVLASAPAPLAVFDVGDDDLQHVLETAFTRDLGQRTSSVAKLREALEEWHPDPNVAGLPGLEDEEAEGGGDDEEEDERTIMRAAPMPFLAAQIAAPAAPAPVPQPPIAVAKPSPPAAVPPPRASSPGAARAPVGSAPGISPLAQPRPGPAARELTSTGPRLAAVPRGPGAGLPAPAVPPPRASRPGQVTPNGVATKGDFPAPAASPPGDFPAPLGPPPGLVEPPASTGDDDDEDEKTMMRTVPEALGAAMAARSASARDADRPHTSDAAISGAFAAVAPPQSGAFPAMPSPPGLDGDEGDDAEDEATRMMPSPAFPAGDDDDDDQATMMRTSLTPEEAERLQAVGAMPEPGKAPLPAAGAPPVEPENNFAATVALDQLGLASPLAAPDARPLETPAADAGPMAPPGAFAPPPHVALSSAQLAPMPVQPAAVVAPPRRSPVLWIAVVALLLVMAGATFFVLRMR